jgi:hypothetical protein
MAHARMLAREAATEAPATTDDSHADALEADDLTLTGERIPITDALIALVKGEGQGDGDADMPPLLKKHRKDSHYGAVAGTAFGDPTDQPSPADVKQGALGDCYLLAALAAVARANPAAIRAMIKENADGSFDVTLYKDVAIIGTSLEKRVVHVTNTFPLDKNGDPLYAQKATGLSGKPALWVMIIEKAYAQREDGYDEIEEGDAGKALQIITGQKRTRHELDDFSELQIISTLDYLLPNSYAVTASPRRTGEDSDLAKEQDKFDIVRKHAYTVLRVEPDKKILLRNPWGYQDPKPMTAAEFKKFYRWFDSVPTK